MKTLRKYFITGLIFLLPLLLTIFILYFIFQKLDFILSRITSYLFPSLFPFLPERMRGIVSVGVKILSLLIIIVAITLVGFLATRVMTRKLFEFIEKKVLYHIPLVSFIYRTLKEINEVLFSGSKYVFKRVVLLEYPRPGVYSIGFVTAETETSSHPDSPPIKMLSIFIPTTPNPTSGWLAIVPERETTPLPLKVEKAMKLVISGGALAPLYGEEFQGKFGGFPKGEKR